MHCRASGQGFEAVRTSKFGGVGSLSTGEEEVKVAKSEVPVITGAWCKRETLRSLRAGGAIRERSSAWTSSSRAARPRCQSGSASTWPRS
ncbi:hypothetical protein SLUN_15345 [Streptomyces lunaelactis]|uniref:Uncharacterized protein n=1 Tax=Streptomyces lunaelactis TaxID=1535768 RepID=A0A2R4T2H9_9ACTN|nr:hypothetical protein SLUN_15345 [Streptomyces lunaelactis]